jgi:hypothetical protein
MTCGGTPCSSTWGYISDTLADISNMIIHNPKWDPLTLYDKISYLLEPPQPLNDSTTFHPAKKLSIDIPENDIGKVDIHIDDSIGIVHDNLTRVSHAIPLAIRAISRPKTPQIQSQEKI